MANTAIGVASVKLKGYPPPPLPPPHRHHKQGKPETTQNNIISKWDTKKKVTISEIEINQ